MIEEIVRNYLISETNTPTWLEFPKDAPERFIVLEVVDRDKQGHIDAVTIEFNSYAESKQEAILLDKEVRKAMENIIEDNRISASYFGGGSSGDNNDEEMKRYCYRCYYNLFYYEED